MRNFFTRTKLRVIISVFTALILGIFIAAVSNSGTSPVSSVLGFIVTPLQNAAVHIASSVEDFNANFISSKIYKDEVEALNSEIADLRSQLVEYENNLHKLEAYEEFLDVKEENPDFSFVPAEIILRDTADIYGSFTLNKGLADGITLDCPVIYGDCLIGIVKEISSNNCTVYTLYHPNVSVSAYEIHTRESCYSKAETALSADGLIRVEGFAKNTPVVSGGTICTSGIGGIYPKDLLIGKIREIRINETGLAAYATVEAEVDFSQITDVFVITDFEGKTNGE